MRPMRRGDCVEIWYESPRHKDGPIATQFPVIDPAASHHLVFYGPRETALGILLNVAGHVRITPAAYGDVERRPGTARIG